MVPVRIVPAILTDTVSELATLVSLANSFAEDVQVDMMDGLFVPSRSVSAADVADMGARFTWEAHLMVRRPFRYIQACADAGASRVIVHAESEDALASAVEFARRCEVGVGVALNPDTSVTTVVGDLPLVDSVLLMTVQPGYYGSQFLPEVLPKIAEVRAAMPEIEIGVDGGIKEQNLREIAAMGVDRICVGSAIFRDQDPPAAYRRLQRLASGG